MQYWSLGTQYLKHKKLESHAYNMKGEDCKWNNKLEKRIKNSSIHDETKITTHDSRIIFVNKL